MKLHIAALIVIFSVFAPAVSISWAGAKVYIDLSAPAEKKLPIAVEDFVFLDTKETKETKTPADLKAIGRELMDALKDDLRFSNLFTIVKNNAPPARTPRSGEEDFEHWRSVGADILVKGAFSVGEEGLAVEVRLYDTVNEKRIMGKRYIGPASNPRRLIHYYGDELYEALTGRKGIFSTKLLFVSDKSGVKEVYMSDYDGKNIAQVTKNKAINLSPQWSPDGKRIIYTSYKNGTPILYMLDIRTGKETVLSAREGINIGARFSPAGDEVALTLSGEKSPELHILNLKTKAYRQMTSNYGIDVSPSWSPDGKSLAFVSDISGNPHIFVLNVEDGKAKRLTFEGVYNASPAWSPDGKKIAYSRSDAGPFNIWVMNSDGSDARQMTFEGNSSSPSWSPDGRHIVFASVLGGKSGLYVMRPMGEGLTRIPSPGSASSPAWSPRLDN